VRTYVVGWLNDATGGQGTAFLVMAVSLAAAAALMPWSAPRPPGR
jgi:hypothetical protein